MVKVKGTKGNAVRVELLGVGNVIKRLRAAGSEVENATDLGVIKAGAFVSDEVKESIIGNRVETKSVDSGLLANSIEFRKLGTASGMVITKRKTYPGTKTTTTTVAELMEFSPNIKGGPRRHFGNTRDRTRKEVKEIIEKEVRLALEKNIRVGMAAFKQLGRLF